MQMGKIENGKKYGLLNNSEHCLNKLYNTLNREGTIEYAKVKSLKDRIDQIKNDIFEGVKISRVDEQVNGEHISTYLIKKQSNIKARQFMTNIKSEYNVIANLDEGTILSNKDSIEIYVRKYYEGIPIDENDQNFFLNFIENVLSDEDIKELNKEITEEEIFNALKNTNLSKSPVALSYMTQTWVNDKSIKD